MGWTLSNAHQRYALVGQTLDETCQETISALSFRDHPHDPEIRAIAVDLSAAVRRLGGALDNPTLASLGQIIVSQLPPLDKGTPENPQIVLLGLDWIERHTPRRAAVNVSRQRGRRPPEKTLDPKISRRAVLDFDSIVAWPKTKKIFFELFGKELQFWIGSISSKNLQVHLLNCDGILHVFKFDASGLMTLTSSPRTDNYGEADLAIPHYIKTNFSPEIQWEYHTCDWDSVFCISLSGLRNVTLRLNKVSLHDPTLGEKRKLLPKKFEVVSGDILCNIWNSPAHVFTAMALGTTDYARGLSGYGISAINEATDEIAASLYWDDSRSLWVHPERFVLAIGKQRKTKGRAVYIGADNVIHLTSRTAPRDSVKTDRDGDMLHDDLISLLWSVAYYGGLDRSSSDIDTWRGPLVDLGNLRLFSPSISVEQALSGSTSRAFPVKIS